MPYIVVTTTNARLDIKDAIEWEDKRSPGLAKRFLADLDSKLEKVAKHPYVYQARYENVRCALTEIFQYLIHFIIDEQNNQVLILRILHTSRKPVW